MEKTAGMMSKKSHNLNLRYGDMVVKNISAHAHTAAPIRTCGCGVRCGIFVIFIVRVGCGAEWLKKCHRTRTLMAGKIWENFLAFFQIFQKKCFHTTLYLTILLKKFSALQLTPHHYFSSASTPHRILEFL